MVTRSRFTMLIYADKNCEQERQLRQLSRLNNFIARLRQDVQRNIMQGKEARKGVADLAILETRWKVDAELEYLLEYLQDARKHLFNAKIKKETYKLMKEHGLSYYDDGQHLLEIAQMICLVNLKEAEETSLFLTSQDIPHYFQHRTYPEKQWAWHFDRMESMNYMIDLIHSKVRGDYAELMCTLTSVYQRIEHAVERIKLCIEWQELNTENRTSILLLGEAMIILRDASVNFLGGVEEKVKWRHLPSLLSSNNEIYHEYKQMLTKLDVDAIRRDSNTSANTVGIDTRVYSGKRYYCSMNDIVQLINPDIDRSNVIEFNKNLLQRCIHQAELGFWDSQFKTIKTIHGDELWTSVDSNFFSVLCIVDPYAYDFLKDRKMSQLHEMFQLALENHNEKGSFLKFVKKNREPAPSNINLHRSDCVEKPAHTRSLPE